MSFRPLWSKPTLLTDWQDEEQEERETYWSSLFYDLIVVAGVSAISDPFGEVAEEVGNEAIDDPSTERDVEVLVSISPFLVNAVLQFAMLVLPWLSLNEFTAIYEDESLVGHFTFFVHLLGLAATTAGCVGEVEANYYNLGLGIILARLGLILMMARPYLYIDKAKSTCRLRMIQNGTVAIVAAWFIFVNEDTNFEMFRYMLGFIIIWDLSLIFLTVVIVPKAHMMRLHVASYTDRFKELTMVIFGEAIFSITQSPRLSSQNPHYYQALLVTLWLIYSLALNEFHVLPRPDDHAIRRSIPFAFAWTFTMFFKTFVLLGTSVGIKRAHYLSWAGEDHIDKDTRYLLYYGIALSLMSVVIVRSFSFGWGRHPGPHDPPKIAGLKILWWTLGALLSLCPMLMEKIYAHSLPLHTPIYELSSIGIVLLAISLIEAIITHSVVSMMSFDLKSGNNYLGAPISDPNVPRYNSI